MGDLLALVGQTALLAFACVTRGTAVWAAVTALLVFATLIARPALQAWRARSPVLPKPSATRCAVMMVFLATLFAISGVRSIYLTPPCGASLNAHPMWHNIFLGLAYNPQWETRFAADYDNAEGDSLAFVAAKQYAAAHALPYQTEPTIWVQTPQTQLMTVEPMPFGSGWSTSRVMRAAFLNLHGATRLTCCRTSSSTSRYGSAIRLQTRSPHVERFERVDDGDCRDHAGAAGRAARTAERG